MKQGLSSSESKIGTGSFAYRTLSCRCFVFIIVRVSFYSLAILGVHAMCVDLHSPLTSRTHNISNPTFLLFLPSYYLVTRWVLLGLSAGIWGDLLGLILYKSWAGNPVVSSGCNGHFMSLKTALPNTAPQPLVLWCFQLQVFYSSKEKQVSRRFEVSQKTRAGLEAWKCLRTIRSTHATAIPCPCVQWVGQK